MGLFDKIKDNARDLSMKAIEATREYEEGYEPKSLEPETSPAGPAPMSDEVLDEAAEEINQEAAEPETPADEPAEEPEKPRKSKVTEIPKAEHEKAVKEKKQAEAKQAAKERLAKSYTPSYKAGKSGKDSDKAEKKSKSDAKKPRNIPVGIIDITPGKFADPTKEALYARERAALNVIASQRKLEGAVPLYVATHMNFKTRVFVNRIEYSGSFGKTVLPIDKIAWVKLRATGTGVILETTEGKRIVMVVKPADRLAFADAILKVQTMQPKKGKFKDTKTVRIDELERFSEGVDEIERLAKLYDKGILSQEEFDAKKKQILGI